MRRIVLLTVLVFFVLTGLAGAAGNGMGTFNINGHISMPQGTTVIKSNIPPFESGPRPVVTQGIALAPVPTDTSNPAASPPANTFGESSSGPSAN